MSAENFFFEHASDVAISVRGADAETWLQSMLTADISDARADGILRSLSLDRLGKIQAELLVLRGPLEYLLIVIGGNRGRLLEHLRRYLVVEDVDLRVTADMVYSLHGPNLDRHIAALGALEGVRAGHGEWMTSDDAICLASASRGDAVAQYLTKECFGGLRPEQWQKWRVERGQVAYGEDFDERDTPGTAALVAGWVSQTKGCYLGQEVVCKMLMRGAVREQSTRVYFDGPPSVGEEILLLEGGEPAGRVTSVSPVPDAAQRFWTIGRVKTGAIEARAEVRCGARLGRICPHEPR